MDSDSDGTEGTSLEQLAELINAAHHAFESGLRAAARAGRLLLEAKRRVRHGQFESWVQANCPRVGKRQAEKYMKLAKHDLSRLDGYSIDHALQELAWESRRVGPAAPTEEEPEPGQPGQDPTPPTPPGGGQPTAVPEPPQDLTTPHPVATAEDQDQGGEGGDDPVAPQATPDDSDLPAALQGLSPATPAYGFDRPRRAWLLVSVAWRPYGSAPLYTVTAVTDETVRVLDAEGPALRQRVADEFGLPLDRVAWVQPVVSGGVTTFRPSGGSDDLAVA